MWEVESLARERRDCRSSSPSLPPRSTTHCQKVLSPRSVFSSPTPSSLACTATRVTCVELLLERPTYEENCEVINVDEYTSIQSRMNIITHLLAEPTGLSDSVFILRESWVFSCFTKLVDCCSCLKPPAGPLGFPKLPKPPLGI